MNKILSLICALLANCAPGFYNALMSQSEWEFLEGRWLPWPVPWHERFGRRGPLIVEIGFGNGEFLLNLATERPKANFVGVEISQPSLRKTQRKIRSRNVENVLIVHGRADQCLWTLFAPNTISGVYINFPDPWPKAGHESRRLIDEHFLSLLASRMRAQARLDIATDVTAYASDIAGRLTSCSQYNNRLPTAYVTEDAARLQTKYESIARAEGRLCYYFHWRRNETPVADQHPVPEEYDMPHVVLNTAKAKETTLQAIAASFRPRTFTGEWGAIRFIDLLVARDHDALLVDTFVDDKAVTQRLGLTIRARDDHTLVVAVHEIGFPRATGGVHRAIKQLVEELKSRHPYLTIVSGNLAV